MDNCLIDWSCMKRAACSTEIETPKYEVPKEETMTKSQEPKLFDYGLGQDRLFPTLNFAEGTKG